MHNGLEFDSEFCHVAHIAKDNVVVLTWKKRACFEDYRTPTSFSAELLKQYSGSNFIVDARNGFEDEKEDVEWGFTQWLPAMAKTECKYVIFIMSKTLDIEEEMDMWSKEFGKYFTVKRAEDYAGAIAAMNE